MTGELKKPAAASGASAVAHFSNLFRAFAVRFHLRLQLRVCALRWLQRRL
jgi:hypothetical protein